MEQFLTIKDFENYEVSNLGNIRNKKTQKIIAFQINDKGYKTSNLWKNNKLYKFKTHRLIAKAFIPNPENKSEIDHIDRNKQNNNTENLRWCSRSENMINAEHKTNNDTKERHIIYRKDRIKKPYNVRIQRNSIVVFSKSFETLEEAKKARDDFFH